MIGRAVALIIVCAGIIDIACAEDLDVITLRDGRVFEGHYNDLTGVMSTVQGKLHALVTINAEDIVSHTTRTVPDADDAPAAPAKTPVKNPPVDKAQQAQRVEDLVARQKLVQAVADATDVRRKLQATIDQDESDQKEIPNLVKDLDQHIADAHDQVDRDIVREAEITAASPGSQAESDARRQHDQDAATLAAFSDQEKTLKKKAAAIDAALPELRTECIEATAKQEQAQAALDALDKDWIDSLSGPATAAQPNK